MSFKKRMTTSEGFEKTSSLLVFYLVALTATAIVLPMCFLGNASGHDLQPHVASWIEVASQWREGIVWPRWAAGANYNFGEPRFIFYPPLSWLMGAVLGSILPWKTVPGVYVWLSIVVAGIAMWVFAREWLSPTRAIVAAILFAANPYHIALVYYRSAFAELLASALFPFVVCGFLGVLRRQWSRAPLLAVSFAAVWLSNAPAAVMTTYSLALLLGVACFMTRSLRPLLFGAVSMVAGLGLAAFYVLPAWWEQRWVQINGAISTTYNPEHNFLFARANEPAVIHFNWKISTVAVVLILLTGIALVLGRNLRHERRAIWWMLAAVSVASIFLMLPLSTFAWRYLPELRYLQFPWRWLLVLGFGFGVFAAAAGMRRRVVWWLTLAIVVGGTSVTIAGDTAWDSEDVPAVVESIRAGHGYEGIEGFQPVGANLDELDDQSPLIGEVDPESGDIHTLETVKINVTRWSAEDKVFETKSKEPAKLALRLFQYPAWEIQVDNQAFHAEAAPQTGQIVLPLVSGTHHVELHFRRTRDRTIGAVISVVSLICFLIPTTLQISRRIRRID